ncbi:MAG: SurA N-terminal domain-containing protein, partial [Alteriqipengyuania sp.]
MINFFRSFFQSKLGLALTIGFLVLIALAFASADVSTTGTFGGLSGTNNVAVVGDEEITTADLRQSTDNALRQVQANEPTLSMEQFIEDGGLTQVLDTLLDRVAVSEFGRLVGLRAGENLINSEIMQLPAFRGADGNFSQDLYQQALRSQGLTDQIVRDDLSDGLIARQVLIPAVFGAKFPDSIVRRYAAQLRESREGSVAILPSELFVPENEPSDEQLETFYRENRSDFIRPERRRIRYATFGADALDERTQPTDAEIRQRYEENAEIYRASEERTFTQVIVPTRQAAESFRERIQGGASINAVASEAGLEASEIGPIVKEDYAQSANAAVANAVFGADEGDVAEIARSPLGFHVVRIDDVTAIPARSLQEARPEIAEALRNEKQRRALNELASEIENRVSGGESFREVAEALDLEVQTTAQLTASGAVFGE